MSRVVRQRQGRPSHGSVVILHLVFKLVAVLLYLLTLHSFITTFILVTLLLSADFWVVKNICGRLLAGLRWWSIVDEEGEVGKNFSLFKIFFQPQALHGREVLLPITSIYYHLDAALNQHQPNISILSCSGSTSLGAPRSELWQSRLLQNTRFCCHFHIGHIVLATGRDNLLLGRPCTRRVPLASPCSHCTFHVSHDKHSN